MKMTRDGCLPYIAAFIAIAVSEFILNPWFESNETKSWVKVTCRMAVWVGSYAILSVLWKSKNTDTHKDDNS